MSTFNEDLPSFLDMWFNRSPLDNDFPSYLNMIFNRSNFKREHFNNLNILTNAYLSPQKPLSPETTRALESLHSNRSEYLDAVTTEMFYLEDDLSTYIKESAQKHGSEPQYFSGFLRTKISPEHWSKVRCLLISPLTLTMAFSYPPTGEEKPNPNSESSSKETTNTSQRYFSTVSPYAYTGTVSTRYEDKNYEILPYSLNTNESDEARERSDLDIFKNLFNRYVTMVDDIISYRPGPGFENISYTRQEATLCQKVQSVIVEPVKYKLNPQISYLLLKDLGRISTRTVGGDLNYSYLRLLYFWCKVLLIDLDPEASIGIDERMSQIQKSKTNDAVLDVQYSTNGLFGYFGVQPGRQLLCSVIFKELLDSSSIKTVTTKNGSEEGNNGLLRMQITAFPIQARKQMFNTSRYGVGVQLADEKIDSDVTLELKKGWTTDDIADHKSFIKIQQQGLRYLTGSSEFLFNHVVYVFAHHGILHFAHVEIDLESLEFSDDPTTANVKKVSLKINKKIHHKEVDVADTRDNNEEITEMAVPVKFKAYPLETVSGKTTVPILSGMVAMIVLVHKLIQKLKEPKELGEIRIKMMALRKALKKAASTIPERERDEEQSDSEKSFRGSADEKLLQREKVKTAPIQPSEKEVKLRYESFDELILCVGAEDEGPLDYVTNTVTVYSEPRITTTMRALTLEEKFGIKYVCPGPQFESENQLANVLFMSPERLKSSVTVFSVKSQNFNCEHDLWRMLSIGTGSEKWKYDRLAFKYYRPGTLYDIYNRRDDVYLENEFYHHKFDRFSSFTDDVHQRYHMNEWKILKEIWKHNAAVRQSGDAPKTIAVPEVLFRGDKMQLNLGRWGDCDDMGFFMVTEALTPESGGWKQTLPLQESVVADACNQIEVMIRQVRRIRHDDLRLANMIFTKGRVDFIDFGQSYWLRQDLTDDRLDQIITEDQKIIRELLL